MMKMPDCDAIFLNYAYSIDSRVLTQDSVTYCVVFFSECGI